MKLVTFQSMAALKTLINKGYLEADEKFIDTKKMGPTYEWVVQKMNEAVPNEDNVKYPLWCWVRCKKGICPPKRKGEPVKGFDVKITFHKPKEEVLITDFRRYSFLLNNTYIPDDLRDKAAFEKELAEHHITAKELKAYVRPDKFDAHRTDGPFLKLCDRIRESFDKCITEESDILQGCIWRVRLDEVEKIEILADRSYQHGTVNYVRSDGKRKNWIQEFYQSLN